MTKNTEESAMDEAAETGAQENEEKKAELLSSYEHALRQARVWKEGTNTPAWREFYIMVQTKIEGFKTRILDRELNSREIIRCQEGADLYANLFNEIKSIVSEVNDPIDRFPLLAQTCAFRALFNEETGEVLLIERTMGER